MLLNTLQLLELAAMANAHWCDIVCTANDAAGTFEPEFWSCTEQVPMYYPNLVTLQPDWPLPKVLDKIKQLPPGGSIKDSFAKLPLALVGYQKLFDAQWILAPPSVLQPIDFQIVKDIQQLKKWETAWSQGTPKGIFNKIILEHPSIRFIAVEQAGNIVAGAIANRINNVIGLSNLFCHADEPANYWLTCVAAAQAWEQEWPVIGYERGERLSFAKTIGFQELGALAVWYHP